jgi:hypothetical protein
MKTYKVGLSYTTYLFHLVEAEDQKEAERMARDGEDFICSTDGELHDDADIYEVLPEDIEPSQYTSPSTAMSINTNIMTFGTPLEILSPTKQEDV